MDFCRARGLSVSSKPYGRGNEVRCRFIGLVPLAPCRVDEFLDRVAGEHEVYLGNSFLLLALVVGSAAASRARRAARNRAIR
jgi:hypothetical protein